MFPYGIVNKSAYGGKGCSSILLPFLSFGGLLEFKNLIGNHVLSGGSLTRNLKVLEVFGCELRVNYGVSGFQLLGFSSFLGIEGARIEYRLLFRSMYLEDLLGSFSQFFRCKTCCCLLMFVIKLLCTLAHYLLNS